MQVITDYTDKENNSSLTFGGMQPYRVVHWLRDVLRNFFASSRNILDSRLCFSSDRKDDLDEERIDAMFRVDTVFNDNARAVGATPLVLVSPVSTGYPVDVLTEAGGRDETVCNGVVRYIGNRMRTVDAKVSVFTDTCDGTLLLAGLLEDFLVTHEQELTLDCGCLSLFKVLGSQGPSAVDGKQIGSSSQLYKSDISVRMSGYLKWLSHSPGPVFRGVKSIVGSVL